MRKTQPETLANAPRTAAAMHQSGELRVRKDALTGLMWFVDEYIGPSNKYPGKWVEWIDGPARSFLTEEAARAAIAKATGE